MRITRCPSHGHLPFNRDLILEDHLRENKTGPEGSRRLVQIIPDGGDFVCVWEDGCWEDRP